jgi:hypothetical protein
VLPWRRRRRQERALPSVAISEVPNLELLTLLYGDEKSKPTMKKESNIETKEIYHNLLTIRKKRMTTKLETNYEICPSSQPPDA